MPNNVNATLNIGLNVCSFNNVTTTCKIADGVLDSNCPSGYSLVVTQACPDIPGYDQNVCEKSCCDGWTGTTCATRSSIYFSIDNSETTKLIHLNSNIYLKS